MKTPYKCNAKLYDDYYLRQAGDGLPVFSGQSGYGIGNILGGLFRAAVPLIKQGGKTLLKETTRAGLDIANDVLSGRNLKTAAKRRTEEMGSRLVHRGIESIRKPIKRSAPRRVRQTKRRKEQDIFD